MARVSSPFTARSLTLALILGAAAATGCGDDDGGGTGGGGTGGDSSTGAAGGGTGGGEACGCAEDEVQVADCEGRVPACEERTCQDAVIGCIPIAPCSPSVCVAGETPGAGCATVGEECETTDCHGNPAETYLCTENQIWTAYSELFFPCGEVEICEHGLEYCYSAWDGQSHDECRPIPAGCSAEDWCSCEEALATCPTEGRCATTSNDGPAVLCDL